MELRLIDANLLMSFITEQAETPTDEVIASICRGAVLSAPTVDAVPVVRCGKCKHYRDGRCYRDGYAYDKWESGDTSESPKNAPVYYGPKETDFCSHGEPRTPPAE